MKKEGRSKPPVLHASFPHPDKRLHRAIAGGHFLQQRWQLREGTFAVHKIARMNHSGLDEFQLASEFLHKNQIALRAFVLVNPPFLHPEEASTRIRRS